VLPDHSLLLDRTLSSVFAQCARGDHDENVSFGLCGIICAILLFPIGLIFLWYVIVFFMTCEALSALFYSIDTEKKCARCGIRLD
jgi:hypothetical protein